MKLKPIVPLISLALVTTLAGCNLDGATDTSTSSGGSSSGGGDTGTTTPAEPTSPLAGAYWNIGSGTAALSGVSTYSTDLPNVHVFSDGTQYYYDDDATPGTYEIKEHSLEEDLEAATLRFTHYDADGNATPVDGSYDVSGGTLTIDTAAFGQLTGSDESDNEAVKAAVEAANSDAGIELPGVGETFDDYTAGTNISEANSVWKEYNTVADSEQSLTSIAIVSSDKANSGSNSLLIHDTDSDNKPFAVREFANGATSSGSVTFDVLIPATNEKTTYINVGAGKNNSDRFFELRLSGSGKIEAETGDSDKEIGNIENDVWNTLSLAWDGDNITVTINGEEVAMTQSETGLASSNTPAQLTLYTGDTSGNDNKAYFDNVQSDLF